MHRLLGECTMEKDKRIVWIDVIKIVAAFLIVMQHSMAVEWAERMALNDLQWKIINLVFIVSRMGVPLFFMCSGVTMFRRKHSIKEIVSKSLPHILVPYAFWMCIYGCIDAVGASSLRVAVNAIIKSVVFGRYHTWFIATLIGLYLVTPLIQEFVYNRKLLAYFLALSVLFTVIFPYAGRIGDDRIVTTLNDFNMHFVVGYVIYYLIGFYISELEIGRKMTLLCGIVFTAACCICQGLCLYKVADLGQDIQNYYSAFSIIGIVLSGSFFIILMSISNKQYPEGMKKVVFGWAKLGIGIYLVHPLLLPLIANLHGNFRFVGGLLVYIIALIINLLISVTPLKKILLQAQ